MTNIIHAIVKEDNLTQEDKALIGRIVAITGVTNYDITNVKFYNLPVETSEHNIYITFGDGAAFTVSIHSHVYDLIKLPELAKLRDKPGNEATRLKVYNELKGLSTYLELARMRPEKTITPEDLPVYTSKILKEIQEQLAAKGISGFTALNRLGKRIRISISDKDEIKEEINLTIAELITLKTAMEIFGIENFTYKVSETPGGSDV